MKETYKPAKFVNAKAPFILFSAFDVELGKIREKRIWISKKIPQNQIESFAVRVVNEVNEMLRAGYCFSKLENVNTSIHTTQPKSVFELLRDLVAEKRLTNRYDTYRTYNSNLNVLEKFVLVQGPTPFNSKLSAYAFRSWLIQQGKSNRTVNNLIYVISGLLKELKKRGLIEENLWSEITPLKLTNTDFNPPFSDYEKEIIETYLQANDLPMYYFTRFVYFGFIRRTELTKLKISAINFQRKTITIPQQIAKNNRTESIPITPPLWAIIEKMDLVRKPTNYYIFGKGFVSCAFPLPVKTVSERHKKAMKKLLIEGKTLYTWKDTGIVNAYLAGVDIRTLQKLVRHHSLEELEIYLNAVGVRIETGSLGITW